MKKYKNIDQLFQDKLNNLDASPSPQVWDEIASKLNNKKDKKFPVWWVSSGVAAVLLLGLFLYPFYTNNTNKPIELTPELIVQPNINKIDTVKNTFILPPKIEVVSTDKGIDKPFQKTSKPYSKKPIQNSKNPVRIAENSALNDSLNALTKNLIVKNKTNLKDSRQKKGKKKLPITNKDDFSTAVIMSKPKNKEKGKRWSLAPVFAFIQSSSFSNGSAIDANLLPQPAKGNSNYSYGIKIAYQLNDRWSIQTGLHKQQLSYATNNLTIATNVAGNNFSNVSYAANTSIYSISGSSELNDAFLLSGANILTNKATLRQRYGYIEFPFEVSYRVSTSKKLNFQLISGLSTLFLNENKIEIISSVFTENLGKANNLNSFNLSGNFGFDFNYKLHPALHLTINPMLKVPFKTFSKDSNGFKPYLVGVYTGITYQF